MKKLILWATVALIAFSSTHQSNAQTNKLKLPRISPKIDIDSKYYCWTETYLNNGTETNLFFNHNRICTIYILNNKNGGTWLYFDSDGCLHVSAVSSKRLKTKVILEDGQKFSQKDYICQLTLFHNGKKKEEGLLLWYQDSNPAMDGSREYGEWIYYDESGKETHRKTFK